MTTTVTPSPPKARVAVEITSRKVSPVKAWAIVGVFFLALQAYVYTRWIASAPSATSNGPDRIPHWMSVGLVVQQVAYVLMAVVAIRLWIVKPWRRHHRLSFDGMLVLVCLFLYWQDPIANYVVQWFAYNTHLVNFGSWVEFMPGWIQPRGGRLVEPFLATVPIYLVWIVAFIIWANWFMKKAKERWPQIGNFGLVMVCYAFLFTADFVFEPLWARSGYYTFNGTVGALTLFKGHYYQFPIYESLVWGICWTALSCVRYYRDDRGRTFVERGVDDMHVSQSKKTGLRFLALVGVFNAIFFLYTPMQIGFALWQDHWPKDITSRSYFMDNICGPGTQYACPGPGIPVNRPDSVHVSPEGKLLPGK